MRSGAGHGACAGAGQPRHRLRVHRGRRDAQERRRPLRLPRPRALLSGLRCALRLQGSCARWRIVCVPGAALLASLTPWAPVCHSPLCFLSPQSGMFVASALMRKLTAAQSECSLLVPCLQRGMSNLLPEIGFKTFWAHTSLLLMGAHPGQMQSTPHSRSVSHASSHDRLTRGSGRCRA